MTPMWREIAGTGGAEADYLGLHLSVEGAGEVFSWYVFSPTGHLLKRHWAESLTVAKLSAELAVLDVIKGQKEEL